MHRMINALRWTAIRAGKLALLLVGLLVLYLVVGTVAGAPADHDVLMYGARAVPVQVVSNSPPQSPRAYVIGPLLPTTSLAAVRCEAWLQSNSGTCPDDAILTSDFWPDVRQAPLSLYVGLFSTCGMSYSAEHLNVDYSTPNLTLHCHQAAPWVSWGRPPLGVSAAIVTDLVVVPTAQMSPGQLYVYREDRVERWWSDEVTTTLIGVATLPKS